jgi:6-phosphofructokinase 2
MVGGLVAALAAGEGLVEAVARGVAAGAAAILTPGTELCRAEDARRLRGEVATRPWSAEASGDPAERLS